LKRKFNKEITISAKHWGDPPKENPDFDPQLFDIYLAGPMSGKDGGNKELFLKTGKQLEECGYSVWNPALQNDENMTFTHCIKNDLMAVICDCRKIALLPDWRESLGANSEVFTAYVCGKKINELIFKDGEWTGHFKQLDDIEFVLPFCPDHKEFRSKEDMTIPEKDVFNKTEGNNNE